MAPPCESVLHLFVFAAGLTRIALGRRADGGQGCERGRIACRERILGHLIHGVGPRFRLAARQTWCWQGEPVIWCKRAHFSLLSSPGAASQRPTTCGAHRDVHPARCWGKLEK